MTVKALKKNNMKTGPFKLKSGNKPSIAKMAGVSPMKTKPTKKELIAAANDPNHPNSIQNMGEDAYYAWKAGGTVKPEERQSNLTHGAGGKLLNSDGTVNKEATRDNVAHLNK